MEPEQIQQTHADPDACEMQFLEAILKRRPRDVRTLKALAELYTAHDRITEGLALDRRLAGLCPDEPGVWYNLGCSLALAECADEAFDALHTALDKGYRDARWMKADEDLRSLRTDPRFHDLLQRLA